jgi:putative sterol carrier protein
VPGIIAAHRRTPLEWLSGALRFQLAGEGGGSWTIRMEQGVLRDVETTDGDVTATVSLTTTDFLRIVRGELHHQFAFFTGRIGVQGDVALLLSLATFIPVLLERFPFRPEVAGGAA